MVGVQLVTDQDDWRVGYDERMSKYFCDTESDDIDDVCYSNVTRDLCVFQRLLKAVAWKISEVSWSVTGWGCKWSLSVSSVIWNIQLVICFIRNGASECMLRCRGLNACTNVFHGTAWSYGLHREL